MRKSLGLIGAIALLIIPMPGLAVAEEQGARTIVLFGATWCAPCRVELRGLRDLAAAAPRINWIIAWDDNSLSRLRFARPAALREVTGSAAAALKARLAPDAAGYPFAVMLDAQGVRCAAWPGPLTPALVDRLRKECASHSPETK